MLMGIIDPDNKADPVCPSSPISSLTMRDLKPLRRVASTVGQGGWWEIRMRSELVFRLCRYPIIRRYRAGELGSSPCWFALVDVLGTVAALAASWDEVPTVDSEMLIEVLAEESGMLLGEVTETRSIMVLPASDCGELDPETLAPLLSTMELELLGQTPACGAMSEVELHLGRKAPASHSTI